MSGIQVLIVEDERIVAEDLKGRLTRLGYGVAGITESGEQAVRLTDAIRPDLVLMDIRLDGALDGIDAAAQIRARFQVPVIYLTAHADDATSRRAIQTEPFGYILKPFKERELQILLDMALYKHKAEKKLLDSERRYATTLASIGEAVVATDGNSCVTFMNPVAEKLIGRSMAESCGQPAAELIHLQDEMTGEYLGWPLDRSTGKCGSDGLNGTMLLRTPDQNQIPIQYSISPIQDASGACTGYVCVFHDVTVERREQQELLRMRALLTQLVEHAPAAMILLDQHGHIVLVNVRAETMFGAARDLMVRRSVDFLIAEGDRPKLVGLCGQCLSQAKMQPPSVASELLAMRCDGSTFPAQVLLAPVRLPEGIHVFCFIIDRTEQAVLEDQLRHAQKMQAVGQLAGGIAHDFNNMLTVINIYAGLLLEDVQRESQISIARDIGRTVDRAAELTRKLLAYGRKQILQPRVLNLNDVVAGTEDILRHFLPENIRLVLNLDPAVMPVRVDGAQMENALINLASNARDAMPSGGEFYVTTSQLSFSSEQPCSIPDCRPGPYVKLVVSDTGCGMSEQLLARAFEPFFTTKAIGKGTGLGLASVYGFIKQSGGHVELASQVGHGTTFTMYLPCVTELPDSGQLAPVPGGSLQAADARH